jgi:hypothetical protein
LGAVTSALALSVSTSTRLLPAFTKSPTLTNHFTMIPSTTLSPSAGMGMASPEAATGAAGAVDATGAGVGAATGAAAGAATGAGAATAGGGGGGVTATAPGLLESARSGSPTCTVAPGCAKICATKPSSVAGTSALALSVSTSTSTSPDFTWSPTLTNHFTMIPSTTLSPSAGIMTDLDIGTLSGGEGVAHRDAE